MKKIIVMIFLLLGTMTSAKPAWALSDQMSLTGVVFNSDGELLTGTQNITFRLYDADDAESPIWEETQAVAFTNGIYAVSLGAVTSFDSGLFSKDSLFLGIRIEGDDEMEPRIVLSSVPWAMQADVANMALSLAESIVTAENISPGSIESAAMASGAIGAAELASSGVTSGTYNNATITVDSDGRITAASSGSGAGGGASGDITSVIAGPGLAGGGVAGDALLFLAAGGVTAAMLAGDVVTADKIAADAIEASEIKTDAVGSDEVATDAIGAAEIAADAVGTSEIATDGVGAAEIAADAVGTSEIATDGVGAAEISADAVGTSEIAADGVDSAEIAAGAVSASELASTTVAAGSYTLSSITVDADGRITLASSGSVSADITSIGDATSGDVFADGASNGTQLIYEGLSVDANETVLTFTGDPGADFTVTIPNVTGTLVTTGDTATVTAAMLGTNSVDADEIAAGSVGISELDAATAGSGLAGGGGSALSVGAGTGIVASADSIAVDVGTTASQILQLDGSAKIPAVDGSLLTALRPGNVQNVLDTNSYTLTDTDSVITNSNASLTPTAVASRVMVMISVTVDAAGGDSEANIFKIWRGSSCSGTQVGGTIGVWTTNSAAVQSASATFVDSPSTTSSQTYVLCEDNDSTAGTAVNNTVIMANVTLMEIGP